jgi:hypothetical protein
VTQSVGTAVSALGVVVAVTADPSRILVGGVALIAVVGGIVAAIYATKRKAELEAANGAAAAWKEERDAEKAKADRLDLALRDEIAARQQAESRTDIRRIEKLCADNHSDVLKILKGLEDALRANTTAVEFLAKQGLSPIIDRGATS